MKDKRERKTRKRTKGRGFEKGSCERANNTLRDCGEMWRYIKLFQMVLHDVGCSKHHVYKG